MTTELQKVFLSLIRLGIGTDNSISIDSRITFQNIDWDALQDLANEQGLSAIVVDGVDKLPMEFRPPKLVLLQWIGETLQGFEYRYELYCRTIAEMAAFYNEHGFKMMVLKGYACGLDWPKPEHRPCGDIDIWLLGQQKEADKVLANTDFTNRTDEGSPDGSISVKNPSQNHIEIDNSHHHHTIFYWRDFMVENHYDFIDVHHRKSAPKLEAIFKDLGQDDSNSIELYGEKVYLPSVNLHALFLVYHTMLHFTSTEMSIRQILDWGLFVKAHTKEIDWDWLLGLVDEFHLRELLNIINAICVEELGFESGILHGVQFNPVLKDRVLSDTFSPEFSGQEPSNLLRRIWFRYRRWKNHEWKHKLCYDESMWSIFWGSVWSHILKPGSI